MAQEKDNRKRPLVGIALGSGSARGWGHIGVLRALSAMGIEADIVCGTSIGALVGAAYVSGRLHPFEEWVKALDTKAILKFLDINLLARGGFVEGKRLSDSLGEQLGKARFEELPKPFAVVAADLASGREVWLREGGVMEAIRASFALPGIFTPVRFGDEWLVDGGLVNPVPVSLCRALGADLVIAVNVNSDILGKHFKKEEENRSAGAAVQGSSIIDRLSAELKNRANHIKLKMLETRFGTPGVFDVIAGSLNIMQDKITRSRMAGDPPDILIQPHLAHIGLLEFDRAKEAILEGEESVRRAVPELKAILP